MRDLTDEELIAQCASGSRRAMDLLVGRYHSRLIDFACRYLGNRDIAADIAQKTLIRAFECAGSYRATASFKTWLYTIALNMVRDEVRKRKVRKESLSSEICQDEEALEHFADRASSGGTSIDAAFERIFDSTVWDEVENLPENQKLALIFRFRHELSYDEISEIMSISSGTVRSCVFHALKKLRRLLSPSKCEANNGL